MENKRKKIKANPLFLSKYTFENVGNILEKENGKKINYEELMKEIIETAQNFYKK